MWGGYRWPWMLIKLMLIKYIQESLSFLFYIINNQHNSYINSRTSSNSSLLGRIPSTNSNLGRHPSAKHDILVGAN
jgi:hypothetical protein